MSALLRAPAARFMVPMHDFDMWQLSLNRSADLPSSGEATGFLKRAGSEAGAPATGLLASMRDFKIVVAFPKQE